MRRIIEATTADRVAARVVGLGVGLIALMVTWLVGNRVAGLIWAAPVGPKVAFGAAIAVGVVVAVIAGIRLDRSLRTNASKE